ncbi:unnamed protein product, partial [Chrysoparadoxa australica]
AKEKGEKKVVLHEEDLLEQFVKGSGPGGQKINKVRSCVVLTHQPTGIQVRCQDERELTTNRKIARKRLQMKVEHLLHGDDSKIGRKVARLQRSKGKRT